MGDPVGGAGRKRVWSHAMQFAGCYYIPLLRGIYIGRPLNRSYKLDVIDCTTPSMHVYYLRPACRKTSASELRRKRTSPSKTPGTRAIRCLLEMSMLLASGR